MCSYADTIHCTTWRWRSPGGRTRAQLALRPPKPSLRYTFDPLWENASSHDSRHLKGPPSMEFFKKHTNFPFMATRKVWYGLSAVLVIVSLALFAVRGLNYSIDFTGGVSIEASFPAAVDTDRVRAGLTAAGFPEP